MKNRILALLLTLVLAAGLMACSAPAAEKSEAPSAKPSAAPSGAIEVDLDQNIITFSTGICAWLRARYNKDDFYIHGFYPKVLMKGHETDEPYKYYDEVCLFNHGNKDNQGFPMASTGPVADEARFKEFTLMGIKPCVYHSMNTDEEVYRLSLERGAIGFTCDHPDICGEYLDKLGARKKRF